MQKSIKATKHEQALLLLPCSDPAPVSSDEPQAQTLLLLPARLRHYRISKRASFSLASSSCLPTQLRRYSISKRARLLLLIRYESIIICARKCPVIHSLAGGSSSIGSVVVKTNLPIFEEDKRESRKKTGIYIALRLSFP